MSPCTVMVICVDHVEYMTITLFTLL